MPPWLQVSRGGAPLLLSIPHSGTDIPPELATGLASAWLARSDTDWWVDRLYGFAGALDATVVRTALSRTVIDANRDPGGASLYPGRSTTGLCPTTTFDGAPLYQAGAGPDPGAIDARRRAYFQPYHEALVAELHRLRAQHPRVVLYDCHSIRSRVPRLFEGELPQFNLGTNDGASCAPELSRAVAAVCGAGPWSCVVNGRFKGGYIIRHHGRPDAGVHALQMELACRGYLDEPEHVTPDTWPPPYDEARAAPLQVLLRRVLLACLDFARGA